ncbi:MAG TPA: nucleotidyltransferase family protein [Longimicrobium sp.]
MPADHVAGVVLAAGASTRFGRNKLLIEIDGETLLHRAVRRAGEAGLDPVLVVVGHEAERAMAEIADLPCRAVHNPDFAQGQNSSVRAGIAAVPADAAAAVIILADMPFVTAEMIAALVDRFRATGAPLVISEYEGVHAPPTLYSRTLFAELAAVEGERCGKHVVKQHRFEAERVAWPAAALADVDVPADVERVMPPAVTV